MADYDSEFTSLVRRYGERLYWHIRSIVNSHDDADDVLQNVFLKAWRGLPFFNRKSSEFTWLWRIATNEALSHLRKEKLRSVLPVSTVPAMRRRTLISTVTRPRPDSGPPLPISLKSRGQCSA